MKKFTVTTFLGVVIALPVIYYLELEPGNIGAIALVLFLGVGVVTAIGAGLEFLKRPKGRKDDE